jgi:hypothetical protein
LFHFDYRKAISFALSLFFLLTDHMAKDAIKLLPKSPFERRRKLWYMDRVSYQYDGDDGYDPWEVTKPGTCSICKDLDPIGQNGRFGVFGGGELSVTRLVSEFPQSAANTGCRFCHLLAEGIASQAEDLVAQNAMVWLSAKVGGCVLVSEDTVAKKFEDKIVLEFYSPKGIQIASSTFV